ncbi:MAG: hypothetical protein WDN67_03165 [Candidatus Moraniibacteriota bacterium]
MKKVIPIQTPVTNLLGHQELLRWYRGAQGLGEQVLCPLMDTVPGLHVPRTLPCDCPDARKHFLMLSWTCTREGECLPRKVWSWPNSLVGNELYEYYRRNP